MELLNPKDVKKILRCSLPQVYKMADRGVLPCVRIPGLAEEGKRSKVMVRFKLADVLEFIEQHYQEK